MSLEKKFSKNVISMALAMVFPSIVNLVLVMIMARILLEAGMNDYNVVVGFVLMFSLISDFGVTGVFVRDVARDGSKMREYFGSFMSIRTVISALMLTLCVVIVNFMPYRPEIVGYVYIFAISQFIYQVGLSFLSAFQAAEKMEYYAVIMTVYSICIFVFGVILVGKELGDMGVFGLVFANLLGSVVLLILSICLMHFKVSPISIKLDGAMIKYLLVYGVPFGLINIFNVAYTYLDRIILSVLKYDEVANYTLPYTLVMSLSFLSMAYMSAVIPVFSRTKQYSDDLLKYAYEKSFKYLFLIMLPIGVGTTLLSDRIIYTIYGQEFTGAIPVLRILIWLVVFASITSISMPLLSSTHRERLLAFTAIAATVANVMLNLILVPALGAIGSSIACVLTVGLLIAVITVYFTRDDLKGIKVADTVAKTGVSAAAMALAIVFVNLNNLILYVIFGAAIYFATFLLVGGLSRDDVDLIKRVLGKKAA